MKTKIFACALAVVVLLFILFQHYGRKKEVTVTFDTNILELPLEKIKNLRIHTTAEKEKLFAEFAPPFPIEAAVKKIRTCSEPQVIIWFADHYGQVKRNGLLWYKQHVFDQLGRTGATFWLADLSAWRFLSLKEEALLQCPDYLLFRESRNRGEVSNNSLTTAEAASLQYMESPSPFSLLRSKDFFSWLNQLPFKIDSFDKTIADLLVRKDLRSGAARFSLAELGYTPSFLNYQSPTIGENLLEADHTQIFPLLQYLEGIYYVLKIVEQRTNKGHDECTIVFLLPNKEFTYYMVPREKKPFETFEKNIREMLFRQDSFKKMRKVMVCFYPFSYGQDFYDAPFEEKGPTTSSSEFLKLVERITIKNSSAERPGDHYAHYT